MLNLTGHLNIDSGQTFTIAGSVTAHDVDLHSTADTIVANTASLNLGGHFHVNAGGNINLGVDLTAANDIQLNAGNTISVQSVSTPSSNFSAQAATFNLNGNITAANVTLQISSAFNGTAGSVVSAQNLSLTMPTAFTFNTTDSSTTRFDLTNLAALTIKAPSIAFDSDITLSNPTGDLTATAGNIDATGHQLTGFDQISATGNFTVAGVTANQFHIGGTLTSPSVTAISNGTIVANALHSDTVTAANSVTVNTSDLAPYSSNTMSINAPNISLPAGATLNGQNGTPSVTPADGLNLNLATSNLNLNGPVSLNGGDGDTTVADAGGNGGQLNITGNNITLNAPVTATSGQNSNTEHDGWQWRYR